MRIHAIDALRALTMLLMIWVNDFWALDAIPRWLGHMPEHVDALGFSDVIFPGFLVIVGLSIPFAIESRKAKGAGVGEIQLHILSRSVALIVMGFFMVNLEYAGAGDLMIPRTLWQVLMIVAFGLIWNSYPRSDGRGRLYLGLKVLGWVTLAGLAASYGHGIGSGHWMGPRWWGILGLIGWAYLVSASVYLHVGQRVLWIALGWGIFAGFNVASFAGWLDVLDPVRRYVWLVGDGAMPAFTMAGVLASTVYLRWKGGESPQRFLGFLVLFGIVALVIGFSLRPAWGISKIQATPAWTGICTGITLLAYAGLYWVVDMLGKRRWTAIFGAAGTATLTCYLVPYLAYPAWESTGIETPQAFRTGVVGLANSMVFAFIVVWLTAALVKLGVRLRI